MLVVVEVVLEVQQAVALVVLVLEVLVLLQLPVPMHRLQIEVLAQVVLVDMLQVLLLYRVDLDLQA